MSRVLHSFHSPKVDNRTGFRRLRGHAARAAQAREALGIAVDAPAVADLPLPLVHGALGLAVCAICLVVRPQTFGLTASVICVGALAAGTAAALTLYDRMIHQPGRRPAAETVAVPAASIIAFAIVLQATVSWPLRIAAAVTAVGAVAAVPYLGGLRASSRETGRGQFARDVLGLIVILPALIAGASLDLPAWTRIVILMVMASLVTLDALHVEDVERPRALLAALVVAGAVTAAALATGNGSPGWRSGLLLVVWYGLRGVAVSLAIGRRGVVLVLEYLAVAVMALTVLAVVAPS